MNLAVVIVGAGSSRRFGSDKLSKRLGEPTVMETSVAALTNAVPETPVILVVEPCRVDHWLSVLVCETGDLAVIGGGERRQDSVRLGVEMAAKRGAEVVMVHDAARPLVHPDDVRRVVDALGDADGAILCAPVVETVKRVDSNGKIRETVSREQLRFAQTPQVFRIAALRNAWKTQDLSRDFSDEASMIEAGGGDVRCVMAEHPNPKLTTAGDLALVRMMAGARP